MFNYLIQCCGYLEAEQKALQIIEIMKHYEFNVSSFTHLLYFDAIT